MEDTKIGKKWTRKEDDQMLRLYNEEKLDIVEIAKQHGRLPAGIAARLVKHGVISNVIEANGYLNHKKSDYYKETMKQKNGITKENPTIKKSQEDNDLITINRNDYLRLQDDISEMKKNIVTLNSNMSELITMIKFIYKFENV